MKALWSTGLEARVLLCHQHSIKGLRSSLPTKRVETEGYPRAQECVHYNQYSVFSIQLVQACSISQPDDCISPPTSVPCYLLASPTVYILSFFFFVYILLLSSQTYAVETQVRSCCTLLKSTTLHFTPNKNQSLVYKTLYQQPSIKSDLTTPSLL